MMGAAALFAVACLVPVGIGAGQDRSLDLHTALVRMGGYVQSHYARTHRIVSRVDVRIQPLGRGLRPTGFGRRLVYEQRVEWDPAPANGGPPAVQVVRELVSVDGRAPKPSDKPGCTDPRLVSPEPLAMLLPDRQAEFRFTWGGLGRRGGRASVRVDYQAAGSPPPTITWDDNCVSMDLPALTRGRVWADAESGVVLRLNERLHGPFEVDVPREHRQSFGPAWIGLDRAETEIRYKSVAFADPDESLTLPASIETITNWRNTGSSGLHMTESFSNYRRFVTDSRILPPLEPR
jgi:hypothetical protein